MPRVQWHCVSSAWATMVRLENIGKKRELMKMQKNPHLSTYQYIQYSYPEQPYDLVDPEIVVEKMLSDNIITGASQIDLLIVNRKKHWFGKSEEYDIRSLESISMADINILRDSMHSSYALVVLTGIDSNIQYTIESNSYELVESGALNRKILSDWLSIDSEEILDMCIIRIIDSCLAMIVGHDASWLVLISRNNSASHGEEKGIGSAL